MTDQQRKFNEIIGAIIIIIKIQTILNAMTQYTISCFSLINIECVLFSPSIRNEAPDRQKQKKYQITSVAVITVPIPTTCTFQFDFEPGLSAQNTIVMLNLIEIILFHANCKVQKG